jgi:hypothetical protein
LFLILTFPTVIHVTFVVGMLVSFILSWCIRFPFVYIKAIGKVACLTHSQFFVICFALSKYLFLLFYLFTILERKKKAINLIFWYFFYKTWHEIAIASSKSKQIYL